VRAVSLAMVGVLGFAPSSLAAQDASQICAELAEYTIGQWAEYRVTAPGMEPGTLRLALVGEEEVDGTNHLWYEMQMGSQMGPMVIQLLVPGYPYDGGEVKRAFLQMGPAPAAELPPETLAMMRQQAGGGNMSGGAIEDCERAENVGDEEVSVPAGSFDSVHLRTTEDAVYDMWVSPKVPFGVIKFVSPDRGDMVLTGSGLDAEPAIVRGM